MKKLKQFNRKHLLRNMRYMSHEKAEILANKQTRLFEISLDNEKLFKETQKIIQDISMYHNSDQYNYGDDINVKLVKGENTLLLDNKDIVIEIIELSSKLELKEYTEEGALFKVLI